MHLSEYIIFFGILVMAMTSYEYNYFRLLEDKIIFFIAFGSVTIAFIHNIKNYNSQFVMERKNVSC